MYTKGNGERLKLKCRDSGKSGALKRPFGSDNFTANHIINKKINDYGLALYKFIVT